MADVRDIVETQLEVVEPGFQSLLGLPGETLASMIQKSGKVKKISRKFYRIPLRTEVGGNFRKVDPDEGSLGVGTGMVFSSLTAAYIATARSYRVSKEQMDTTGDSRQAVVNILSATLAEALEAARGDDEVTLFTDGTGQLTNASSAVTNVTEATMTFAGATDQLGVNRLYEGQTVEVWSGAGILGGAGAAVKRVAAATPARIKSIDYAGKVVTLSTTFTGLVAGDVLFIPNIDVYGPTAPQAMLAAWPATGGMTHTTGGDSFRHGIYYAHNITGANYYLGRQRSAIPQLNPERVNGSSALLDHGHGLLMLGGMQQRRKQDALAGLIGIFHQAQRQRVFEIGMAIATKQLTGDRFGVSLDLMPSNWQIGQAFNFCDIPSYVCKQQYRDRVDFIIPRNWFRSETQAPGFYQDGGRRTFEGRNSSGEVTTLTQFFVYGSYDFGTLDPGAEGMIDSLLKPSGW